ncbi:hypothetical protein ACHQM5_027108 [Ranunculus cassubicifolius]
MKLLKSNCTLEDYINFHGNHHTPFLSRDSLNQIIQMHGFQKLHNSRKKDVRHALSTVDLVSPYRSSLAKNVSACASLSIEDVRNDLDVLQWEKCSIHSIKTFKSRMHLEKGTLEVKPKLLESGNLRMKPTVLEYGTLQMKPTLLENGALETKPMILENGALQMKPTVVKNGTLEMKPMLLENENATLEMKPMLLENAMLEMKPTRTRVRQQEMNKARKKRTVVTYAHDIVAANAVSALWLTKVDYRMQRIYH